MTIKNVPNFSSFNNMNLNLWHTVKIELHMYLYSVAPSLCLSAPEWWILPTAGTFISIKTISTFVSWNHKALRLPSERHLHLKFMVLVSVWFISSFSPASILLHVVFGRAHLVDFVWQLWKLTPGLVDDTLFGHKFRSECPAFLWSAQAEL